MMVYVLIYHIVARLLLRRKDPQVLPFHHILIWLLLILLPLEGLFYYSFHTVRMSYYVIETILLVILFKYKIRLWHKNKEEEDTSLTSNLPTNSSLPTDFSTTTEAPQPCQK